MSEHRAEETLSEADLRSHSPVASRKQPGTHRRHRSRSSGEQCAWHNGLWMNLNLSLLRFHLLLWILPGCPLKVSFLPWCLLVRVQCQRFPSSSVLFIYSTWIPPLISLPLPQRQALQSPLRVFHLSAGILVKCYDSGDMSFNVCATAQYLMLSLSSPCMVSFIPSALLGVS